MDNDFSKDEQLEKLVHDLKSVKRSEFEFHDNYKPTYSTGKGLTAKTVEEISEIKKEPEWMKRLRLKALEIFLSKPVPTWGPDLSGIDWDNTSYYNKPGETNVNSWDEVPDQIKETFQKLGVPEMEQKFLAGSVAQYDSEGVYHNLKKVWEDKGVVFMDLDSAVKNHPDLVKDYYCKAVPFTDNKFAALNGAVWSGGSFLYVPKGVQIDMPLQTYFRMNGEATGQFEHTIVVADEGSKVHYVEGCLPPDEIISKGDSFVPISSVRTSESVMTHSGQSSDVTLTFTRPYEGRMLTITPVSEGNAFRLTVEHPVLAVKRSEVVSGGGISSVVPTGKLLSARPDFVRADELEEGDYIVYVAPTETSDDPHLDGNHLRILGLFASTGTIKGDALTFRFRKSEKAEDIARELREIINASEDPGPIETGIGEFITVTLRSPELIGFCRRHAGEGRESAVLSREVMLLPADKQRLLVEYFLKGGGSGASPLTGTTPSRTLAFQMQEILARGGLFAELAENGGIYSIQFSPDSLPHEVIRQGNTFLVPVRRITGEPYRDLVYNLEVSNQNTYLVRGFAVHNCTAPKYDRNSLHSAIVEIYAKKNSQARYTSVQNWSKSVYNMPTKRAWVDENAKMEWVGGSLGSKITMLYPSSYLRGSYASASNLNISLAGGGTFKDTGAKALHLAPHTTSKIVAKSISIEDGKAIYRGLLRMNKGAVNSTSRVQCDALLINDESSSLTFPHDEIYEPTATFSHEASVGKIGTEELTYMRSRGLSEDEASSMIVLGFLDDVMKEIPMEFAVEMNRLIKLEMGKLGSVG
ncbi:MAG: Fe-S cluster assembly protein SufB [Candidatus Thermoplasmatota archaeon]|nr:Fe-S cluster assembly protein SufB [Candidatus Thermoplasmatota archaeon]